MCWVYKTELGRSPGARSATAAQNSEVRLFTTQRNPLVNISYLSDHTYVIITLCHNPSLTPYAPRFSLCVYKVCIFLITDSI